MIGMRYCLEYQLSDGVFPVSFVFSSLLINILSWKSSSEELGQLGWCCLQEWAG